VSQTPDEPFADVPLLRELQRVLLAGTGPINWELARQVGIASASWGGVDPAPGEDDRRGFEEAVRMAELAVADLTGLPSPPEITRITVVRRAGWVDAESRALQGLFEPAAERLGRALGQMRGEEAEAPEGAQMMQALVDRMGPLLMGAQLGVVLGALGQRVFGRYDLPLPRAGEGAVAFVVPNIDAFEREWSLPVDEFRARVALHETAHVFQLSRGWVRDHVVGLLREVAEGMEFDLAGLEERLAGLDLSDPQRLTEALGSQDLFGPQSEEQRMRLRRVQSFLAATEGHADRVVETLGRRILSSSYERIDEALRRRDEGGREEDRAVQQLLGLEGEEEASRLGRAFADRVAELTDDRTLARMWEGPDALPSWPELEEPRLWLARMA
jgi:putative hydrolase